VLDASQAVDHVAAAFGVSRATLYRNLAEHIEEQQRHDQRRSARSRLVT
jgi:predicted transcriptional regulator YheO